MGGIMRLKNKKTGEIAELRSKQQLYEDEPHLFLDTKNGRRHYTSLAELNEEWEDYEEPKKHYSITQFGDVVDEVDGYMSETIDEMKEIGNYFDTREEAEKAVERLRAWKRLKDKGFRHTHFVIDHKTKSAKVVYKAQELGLTFEEAKQFYENFYLLFGGKDE